MQALCKGLLRTIREHCKPNPRSLVEHGHCRHMHMGRWDGWEASASHLRRALGSNSRQPIRRRQIKCRSGL